MYNNSVGRNGFNQPPTNLGPSDQVTQNQLLPQLPPKPAAYTSQRGGLNNFPQSQFNQRLQQQQPQSNYSQFSRGSLGSSQTPYNQRQVNHNDYNNNSYSHNSPPTPGYPHQPAYNTGQYANNTSPYNQQPVYAPQPSYGTGYSHTPPPTTSYPSRQVYIPTLGPYEPARQYIDTPSEPTSSRTSSSAALLKNQDSTLPTKQSKFKRLKKPITKLAGKGKQFAYKIASAVGDYAAGARGGSYGKSRGR